MVKMISLNLRSLLGTKRLGVPPLALAAIMIVSCMLTVWFFDSRDYDWRGQPRPYTYMKLTASNNVVLHTVKTTPRNIALKAINTNVTKTKDYGINGGFFYNGDLLSLAVINNKPVKGKPGDYGTGWYNTDRPRGTLVWDDAAELFTVQIVEESDQVRVVDRSRFWAQGGVSMGLLNEAGWEKQATAEEMPAQDEERLRSGMVYDTDKNVWLVVTSTPCTVKEFRNAVKEMIAKDKLIDGIFLDGDGSSQLKVGRHELPGDKRPVYQMITLVNK